MRLLFALICLSFVAYAQSSAPVIVSATPTTIDAAGPSFTVTVTLGAFQPGAVVNWSGTPLATVSVNDTTWAATVPAGLIAICGKYSLTVTDPRSNTVSNTVPIVVNPVLQSISPNTLPAGIGGATVSATGLGFSSNVKLTLITSNTRTNLATNYGGSTSVSAFAPASAFSGTYTVLNFAVTDPTSGAVSQSLPLTVTSASLSRLNPNSIIADIASAYGLASFGLIVGGANFTSGAQVLFGGVPLFTRVDSSSSLTAQVTADLVHDAGPGNQSPRTVLVSMKNPGAAASNALAFTLLPNPYGSTIVSLSPASVAAGAPGFTLTVTGQGFAPGSTVQWLTTKLPTTFVSSTQLTATVPASLVAAAGVLPLTVFTPDTFNSNSLNLTVVAVTPSIAPNGISPSSAVAGGPAFTLTVTGDGFIPGSQVTGLAGATTTYVSLNQLTVNVPASAIAVAGSYPIQVVNPGGFRSLQAPIFTVKALAPVLTSLSPGSAAPGGAAFTLTVAGTGFTANSTVQWNGSPLATTFVNTTQLTARVPAALIAAAGTASIVAAGDGVASNPLSFTIAPLAPATSSAGIVNAASNLPAIAPGTLIAIYGTNLAAATDQASATPLPKSLSGTTVSINGASIPLLFVSASQINGQVPYETKVGTAKLVVQSGGVVSPEVNFEVAATGPGVFTPNPQPNNHVLALNLSDGTLNAPQTPARPGQYVTAYLTGQGVVNPAATTGDVAPSTPPFPVPVAPVVVKIGGQIASVPFAGLAPGFIGLLQMNVQIPDVPPGELSFDVSVGGVAAAPTVISVGK